MKERLPIAIGALVAAVLTHGLVYAGCRLDRIVPIDSYQGFFQSAVLLIETLWSHVHGWEPLSHIRGFGPWFAKAVHFACPTIGFLVFWLLSRQRIGRDGWKPLTIVTVFMALTELLLAHGPTNSALWLPWVETASVLFVFALMVRSVGISDEPRLPCARVGVT